MREIHRRLAVVAATATSTMLAAGVFAGVASARTPAEDSFLQDLVSLGEKPNVAAPRVADSTINLGYAICQELGEGSSPADVVLHLHRNGKPMDSAANWVVVAQSDLCPQYKDW
ncbi:DUF732 domain-containing protein [Nocardia sp. CA-120079]|uniref:DUF732 domain-containing protein n=1 Tax=Nocardia sp. CA-120079 TaxID=3239974 RepID=UPI003D950D2D